MRVLVVDDSVVFRTQISAALAGVPGVQVVGTAPNGRIALQKLEQGQVDLVTLDLEMPEMGGLETLKRIRERNLPVRVILFSSLTAKGAEATLSGLAAGADDFVTKPEGAGGSFESAAEVIGASLVPKVRQFLRRAETAARGVAPTTAPVTAIVAPAAKEKRSFPRVDLTKLKPSALVIASSTGGPAALERVFARLPGPYRIPVLLVQHMPPVFTAILAKRLGELTQVESAEAKHGESVEPNRIYVAPGDYHLGVVRNSASAPQVALNQGPHVNSVRPAADLLFTDAAKVWARETVGVVLTGMGEDGKAGCIALKEAGAGVMIQDPASSVVFGMPGAVHEAGAFDAIGTPEEIAGILRSMLVAKG